MSYLAPPILEIDFNFIYRGKCVSIIALDIFVSDAFNVSVI